MQNHFTIGKKFPRAYLISSNIGDLDPRVEIAHLFPGGGMVSISYSFLTCSQIL
jgi:hypothetical protein